MIPRLIQNEDGVTLGNKERQRCGVKRHARAQRPLSRAAKFYGVAIAIMLQVEDSG